MFEVPPVRRARRYPSREGAPAPAHRAGCEGRAPRRRERPARDRGQKGARLVRQPKLEDGAPSVETDKLESRQARDVGRRATSAKARLALLYERDPSSRRPGGLWPIRPGGRAAPARREPPARKSSIGAASRSALSPSFVRLARAGDSSAPLLVLRSWLNLTSIEPGHRFVGRGAADGSPSVDHRRHGTLRQSEASASKIEPFPDPPKTAAASSRPVARPVARRAQEASMNRGTLQPCVLPWIAPDASSCRSHCAPRSGLKRAARWR